MEREPRPYTPDDLPRVLEMVGRCNAANDLCADLHPGDVAHHLTNAMRGADPSPYFHVYEHGAGEILALVELDNRGSVFVVVVHPDHRADLERGLIEWAARRQQAVMSQTGIGGGSVSTDCLDCDTVRTDLLTELGYTPDAEPHLYLTVRDLTLPIPTPVLPEGFVIRPAAGVHEADALGRVHASAFGSNWPPSAYIKVMQTPGFQIDREMVVVAPDGEFAAFLVYWLDPVSKSGLFEPVGCAQPYQRRGLTKALMNHTLALMRDAGMTRAVVMHDADNPASTAAYASVGFVRRYACTNWRSPASTP